MLLRLVTVTLLMSGFVLSSVDAYAQAKNTPKRKVVEVDEEDGEVVETKRVRRDTQRSYEDPVSAEVRQTKRGGASLLYSLLSGFALNYGVGGFTSISPDFQVGGAVLTGSDEVSATEGSIKASATVDGFGFYGYARHFFGNSFAGTIGLGYRSGEMTYEVRDTLGFQVNGDIKITSIVVPVYIGNHWAWDSGFSLGVDWIGAQVPLSGSAKVSTSGNLEQASLRDLNDKMLEVSESLAKTTSLTLCQFSFTYMF